ncbi:MAG: glycosyltransferase family 4 protein [Ruminococcaceae bacterium]|nr:glycosyltransferase family 4 protein [Oscillospiraceae bacterium]
MIKVLNILTDTNVGGAGRIFLQYLKCIDRTRFDIYTAIPSGSMLIPLIKELGFDVIETEFGHDKTYEKGAVSEYKRIIKDVKPDIVHTHSSFAGKIAAYLCGIKSRIYTRHSAFEMTGKLTKFPFKQVNGFIDNRLSTEIIAVCKAAAENLTVTGVSEKKITVILNGVEPVRELSEKERAEFRRSVGIGDDEFVGLISARLEDYKGHRFLVEAAKIIRDKMGDSCRLKIVFMGDGTERENLERQTKEFGVEDMIIFTGFVSDIAPWCNIMDLTLNASLAEALSLAICEGLSLGKPAVVSDFGGNPEVVTDGENGLIVPTKDSAAIADAIMRIMESPELYEKLSKGAIDRYHKDFTSQVMTDRVMELYEKSVARWRK